MIYVYLGLFTSILALVPTKIYSSFKSEDLSETNSFKNKSVMLPFFVINFGLYLYIAGTRYFVGTDYRTYLMNQIPQALYGRAKSQFDVEFLYKQLIKFGMSLGSYQWIFVLTHLIILYFVFRYIWDRSSSYGMSFFILLFSTFFNFSLNGMRQAIATSIFLFATKYITKKEPMKYFLLILVATLFHKSAYVFFLFYFCAYIDFKHLKAIFLGVIVAAPLLLRNLDLFHSLLYKLTLKIGLYNKFFGSIYDKGGISKFNLAWLLINLVIFFVLTFGVDVDAKERLMGGETINEALKTDTKIEVFIMLFCLLSFAIPGSFRVFYMFIPIYMSLIPNMLSSVSNNALRFVLKIGIMAMFILLFVYVILMQNQNETLPYQSIFKL